MRNATPKTALGRLQCSSQQLSSGNSIKLIKRLRHLSALLRRARGEKRRRRRRRRQGRRRLKRGRRRSSRTCKRQRRDHGQRRRRRRGRREGAKRGGRRQGRSGRREGCSRRSRRRGWDERRQRGPGIESSPLNNELFISDSMFFVLNTSCDHQTKKNNKKKMTPALAASCSPSFVVETRRSVAAARAKPAENLRCGAPPRTALPKGAPPHGLAARGGPET